MRRCTGSHAESVPRSSCWCVGTRYGAAAFNSGNGPEHGRYRTLELSMSGWNEVNTGSAVGAPRAARRVVWGIHCAMAVETIHLQPLTLFRCSHKSRTVARTVVSGSYAQQGWAVAESMRSLARRSMVCGSSSTLSHSIACYRLGVIRGASECSDLARRTARIGSL